ncbi:hypothetical protein Ancab_004035 [Ancistrocladus abbreviatus]
MGDCLFGLTPPLAAHFICWEKGINQMVFCASSHRVLNKFNNHVRLFEVQIRWTSSSLLRTQEVKEQGRDHAKLMAVIPSGLFLARGNSSRVKRVIPHILQAL